MKIVNTSEVSKYAKCNIQTSGDRGF